MFYRFLWFCAITMFLQFFSVNSIIFERIIISISTSTSTSTGTGTSTSTSTSISINILCTS